MFCVSITVVEWATANIDTVQDKNNNNKKMHLTDLG